jgi:hypothetical protein
VTWRWVGEPISSEVGLNRTFPTQGEAETWIGECYPDLLDKGVRSVSLYEEDRLVYGPMRLEPEIT